MEEKTIKAMDKMKLAKTGNRNEVTYKKCQHGYEVD